MSPHDVIIYVVSSYYEQCQNGPLRCVSVRYYEDADEASDDFEMNAMRHPDHIIIHLHRATEHDSIRLRSYRYDLGIAA